MPEEQRRKLFERIGEFVRSGEGGDDFNSLCLDVFAYQYQANEAYKSYCLSKKVSPQDIASWADIPAFPSEGFKKDIIISFPLEKMVMENITGGSTCPELRGGVFRDEYGRELALGCNRKVMGDYIFPEGERMPILVLAPSPEMAPAMGMAIGMAETIRHFGTESSGFYITRMGLRIKKLFESLRRFERERRPVAVIGATSAFVYIFNACRSNGIRFSLPEGSRIADGGGYRGKFGECTREMYYRQCREILGVPEEYCVNVLGMAECTTNFVDSALRDAVNTTRKERRKPNHPWARVVAFDIETCSRPLPGGEMGLLRHYDLANLPTVIAVQTDNLGYTTGDGFEIVGRAKISGGKVSRDPSEKPVGPMGDKKIFSFLDTYMKFSIEKQIARLKKDESFCPCGEIVDEMIAGKPDSIKEKR